MFDVLQTDKVVQRVAKAFRKHDQPLFLVGGEVRRLVAGDPIGERKDYDFTTPASPEKVQDILSGVGGETFVAGKKFGTVGAMVANELVEITTFRTERYVPGDRHPEVEFVQELEADLERRDFTVNAMAVRVDAGNPFLVDPFNGEEDLRCHVLRTPSEPMQIFLDDPLRIMRLVRFVALKNMIPDTATLQAASILGRHVAEVAIERRLSEVLRVLTEASPVQLLRAINFATLVKVRSLMFGQAPRELARIALNGPRSVSGRLAGITLTGGDLEQMRLPNHLLRAADRRSTLARELETSGTVYDWPLHCIADTRALIRKYSNSEIEDALRLAQSLAYDHRVAEAALVGLALSTDPVRTKAPVTGDDALLLGQSGRQIGVSLNRVEKEMCRNPRLTRDEALAILRVKQ